MKDLKTYLESGILELYVLGDLSSEEVREVEEMAMQYPEVKSELDAIENALINYAATNSIEPPASLRDKILNSLESDQTLETETPVKPIHNPDASSNFYKYAFAASVALLFVSAILLINLNNKLKESNTLLAVLQSANTRFTNQVNFMNSELQDTRKFLDIYQNPAKYKMVNLKGSPKAPEASMLVAFNPEQEEVMIDLSSLNMPANDQQHQYQLWALVDGKPVDLGVFDASDDKSGMKKMKSVKGAQAFAVTLEPAGGSVNPTMDQMMAIGNI